jgi:formylglycine-generating enzyme required for sulfatase activity
VSGSIRVLRGGYWGCGGGCRAADRFISSPGRTFISIGFRAVRR